MAGRIYKAVRNAPRLPNPLFRSFLLKMMAGMQKKNDWNKTDRDHWETQGWLAHSRPF
ncbi:MAG: hypothetical protein AAGU74_07905 [Bacillota bacterium]